MLAGGAALFEASHMYRSSLTLAFVVLCAAGPAASDLSSVYVAPGGIYARSANVYVRPGPSYRQPPYAEPGYGYRQPSYGTPGYETPGPAYRAPASVYGGCGTGRAAQPRYVARAPAAPPRHGRSTPTAPPPTPSVTTLRSRTTRRNATMRRGRLCPCPTVRGRDASSTTAMAAGGPPAIKPRWVTVHLTDATRAVFGRIGLCTVTVISNQFVKNLLAPDIAPGSTIRAGRN